MYTGLPAAMTFLASARCGRPSSVLIITASTFGSRASIESTISTSPRLRRTSPNCLPNSTLAGTSGVPPRKAATTLHRDKGSVAVGSFIARVNSVECGVSTPMMPTLIVPSPGGRTGAEKERPTDSAVTKDRVAMMLRSHRQ